MYHTNKKLTSRTLEFGVLSKFVCEDYIAIIITYMYTYMGTGLQKGT